MAEFNVPEYFKQPGLQPRRLRVVGIGAGASGLLLAYKIQRNFDHVDLKIFEKNEGQSIHHFMNLNSSGPRGRGNMVGGEFNPMTKVHTICLLPERVDISL